MRAVNYAIVATLLVAATVSGAQRTTCNMPTQTCLDVMAKELGQRGWAGLELQEGPGGERLIVTQVHEKSPAEAAGLKVGDVIVAVNDLPYTPANAAAIRKGAAESKPGMKVTYTVLRGETQSTVPVTLVALPRHLMAQRIGEHMLEHVTVYPQTIQGQPVPAVPPGR